MNRESSLLEEIAENTLRALKKAGFIVKSISYPANRRSIDIVGSLGGRKVIIKTSVDSNRVTDVEVSDLKKASTAYTASTLIVSRKHSRVEIEDDVVYERKGIRVVNDYTFREYVLHSEKPLVESIQGTYVVRVDPERFRKRRLELGYSLGETASLLGVSRKAVYEYERGRIAVRLDTALRIAEVFGEDVLEPIELFKPAAEAEPDTSPSLPVEKTLVELAERYGLRLFRLRRTPVDYVLKGEEKSISIVYRRYDRGFRLKVSEAHDMVRVVDSRFIIMRGKENEIRLSDLDSEERCA